MFQIYAFLLHLFHLLQITKIAMKSIITVLACFVCLVNAEHADRIVKIGHLEDMKDTDATILRLLLALNKTNMEKPQRANYIIVERTMTAYLNLGRLRRNMKLEKQIKDTFGSQEADGDSIPNEIKCKTENCQNSKEPFFVKDPISSAYSTSDEETSIPHMSRTRPATQSTAEEIYPEDVYGINESDYDSDDSEQTVEPFTQNGKREHSRKPLRSTTIQSTQGIQSDYDSDEYDQWSPRPSYETNSKLEPSYESEYSDSDSKEISHMAQKTSREHPRPIHYEMSPESSYESEYSESDSREISHVTHTNRPMKHPRTESALAAQYNNRHTKRLPNRSKNVPSYAPSYVESDEEDDERNRKLPIGCVEEVSVEKPFKHHSPNDLASNKIPKSSKNRRTSKGLIGSGKKVALGQRLLRFARSTERTTPSAKGALNLLMDIFDKK